MTTLSKLQYSILVTFLAIAQSSPFSLSDPNRVVAVQMDETDRSKISGEVRIRLISCPDGQVPISPISS